MTYSKDKVKELLQELRDHLGLVHDPKGKTLTLLDEALALLDAPEGEGREGPQWITLDHVIEIRHAIMVLRGTGVDVPNAESIMIYLADNKKR